MTHQEPEFEPLLRRLQAGDQQALGELYALLEPRLRRMVQLRLDPRLNGRVAASDVLQEGYIDALKRFPHYFDKPDQSFYVWFRLVVSQTLIGTHRRHLGTKMRGGTGEVSLQSGFGVPGAGAASAVLARELIAGMASPSVELRQAEALGQVERALESLDPVDREILTLRHFEELGNDEVAELLGLQKAAASNRYVRALGRLRAALAKVPGFFDDDGDDDDDAAARRRGGNHG